MLHAGPVRPLLLAVAPRIVRIASAAIEQPLAVIAPHRQAKQQELMLEVARPLMRIFGDVGGFQCPAAIA
jgi:hypothetical protein